MEYDKCVKCGFTATPDGRQFKTKYQERCYNTSTLADCNWADLDVREHLHVICPDCGFLVGAKACLDYKDNKASKTKTWTPQRENTSVTGTVKRFTTGQGRVDTENNSEGGWDTACPQCPITESEK